jgi:hypothetical protein
MSADGAGISKTEGATTAPIWSLAVSIAIPEPNFIQICAASEWLDPASRRAFLLETAAANRRRVCRSDRRADFLGAFRAAGDR